MTEFSHTRVLQQEELNEVIGARDDVAEQEDAVHQPQILRVLRLHVLPLRPAHPGSTRRHLATAQIVISNVIIFFRLLVAAVRRPLHNPNVGA